MSNAELIAKFEAAGRVQAYCEWMADEQDDQLMIDQFKAWSRRARLAREEARQDIAISGGATLPMPIFKLKITVQESDS